jgi:uncharacterized protein YecT (DUF1311 family)
VLWLPSSKHWRGSGPASAHATSAPPFADIVEPFDPAHPAQAKSAPADCGSQSSTLAIVQCFENETETTDAQIDAVGRQLYNTASLVTVKTAIVEQLDAWLTARGPVCQAAFTTGGNPGSVDQVNIASCLLDESTARLDAIKDITPPEARLTSTDSTDPSQLSWYTTPEGSRIAEIDTQGDQTGGSGDQLGHRLLQPVQGPERRPGQRRVRLRARHPGRRLAVTRPASGRR